jgi:hypothetical protein
VRLSQALPIARAVAEACEANPALGPQHSNTLASRSPVADLSPSEKPGPCRCGVTTFHLALDLDNQSALDYSSIIFGIPKNRPDLLEPSVDSGEANILIFARGGAAQ